MMKKPADMPPDAVLLGRLHPGGRHRGRGQAARASSAGQVIRPPAEIEPGIFAVVTDPAGAMFNLFQPKE